MCHRVPNEFFSGLILDLINEGAQFKVEDMTQYEIGHDTPHVASYDLVVSMYSVVYPTESNHKG